MIKPIYLEIRELLDSCVIIGLGNLGRKDDGIGIYCANKLKSEFDGLQVYTEDEFLIDEILLDVLHNDSVDNIIFIDACSMGMKTGEIAIIHEIKEIEPEISTHKFPLTLYIELLRHNHKNVRLIGIQVDDLSFERGLSKDLEYVINKQIIPVFIEILHEFV